MQAYSSAIAPTLRDSSSAAPPCLERLRHCLSAYRATTVPRRRQDLTGNHAATRLRSPVRLQSELPQLRHLHPLPVLLRREELSGRASVREVPRGYAGDGKHLDESVGMVAFSK
jgi:hypothetical protein